MTTIPEFFGKGIKEIEKSIKDEGLPIAEDSITALAIVWSTKGVDGLPTYNRVTMEKYTGRRLIELFSRLADMEEDELIESNS